MTLTEAITAAIAQGLARLDAQRLLLHALGRAPGERAWLLAHDTDELAPATQAKFDALVERCRRGEPLAYITGTREFYGLDLRVDARVLDPRPDTETLVDWALDLRPHPVKILDLGTGSGAIALALKQQRPDADITATDASTDALEVARSNAQRLGLQLRFAPGAWFDALHPLATSVALEMPLERAAPHYDLILSNPPYIAAQDPHLAALQHEPLSALTSGPDGLNDIRHIINTARAYLRPGAWLLLEHGYDQAHAVRALLQQAGFEKVQSRLDLNGVQRCSGGCHR